MKDILDPKVLTDGQLKTRIAIHEALFQPNFRLKALKDELARRQRLDTRRD